MQTHALMLDLERVEREAWEDLARVMPAELAQGIGLRAESINNAYLFMASRVPQYQFNWLSGAGLNGDDGRSIDEAVKHFREASQHKFFIQIPPGPLAKDCEARAAAAGLRSHPLAWAKFIRLAEDPPLVETSLTVREIDVAEADVFASTACAGFGMPPSMEAWLRGVVGLPRWHAYVSFDGNEPAGAAAMYVHGDFAWLGIGATKSHMRKRGGQSALLSRRIADARKFGARHASTETGVPQAGQPAPSYANILRAGFSVAYVRPNWAEST
jgi:hypothetical protein